MRCFIGIFLPSETQNAIRELLPDLPNTRWTKPERYHITLKFVANLNPSAIPKMLSETRLMSTTMPISCRATVMDGFPTRRRARVVIVRVDSGGAIESIVGDKKFQSHVTIGYARKKPLAVPATNMDLSFEAQEALLVESRNGEYRVISP